MTAPFPTFTEPPPCAQPGVSAEWFHPGHDAGHALRNAMSIRKGTHGRPPCPFLDPCAAYALTHDVSGIWAGTNGKQRDAIRRARHIRAVRTEVLWSNRPFPTEDLRMFEVTA